MEYRRMPIEIEAPEAIGYDKIECNLSESSFADQRLKDLGISVDDVLLFYGNHQGKTELRELVAADAAMHTDDILITPGAAGALFIVATSMLSKGDRLIVEKPNYATNIETPRAIGADIAFLQLDFENGFRLDIQQLQNLITPTTKLVSLTYPHNPTGVMIDADTLQQVINIVEQHKCYLLVDETYREMSFTEKLPVAASLSQHVISVSSMSKAYGLAGIRTGWIACGNKQLMQNFLAAKEQIIITNSVIDESIAYQYLCNKERLFAPVQQKILKHFSIVKNFMQQQDMLEWIEPQGGCVCFPRVKKEMVINMQQFHELLFTKYSTWLGRGHWFEEDDRHIRIGFGWETTAKLAKGLQNIQLTLTTLKANSWPA